MASKNFVVKNGLNVNTLQIIDSNGNITANTISGAINDASLTGTTTIIILNVSGNTALGNVALSGDIIPTTNNTINLGSAERAFGSLFLNGATITLGGVELKESGGSLTVQDRNNASANVVISANTGITINGVRTIREDGAIDPDTAGQGFKDNTLYNVPTGDLNAGEAYVGASTLSVDPFGVLAANVYSCMEPIGRTKTTDFGSVA